MEALAGVFFQMQPRDADRLRSAVRVCHSEGTEFGERLVELRDLVTLG